MRTALICTCQYPISGLMTGDQVSGDSNRSGLWPPTASSLSSPSSPSVRKIPKVDDAIPPDLLRISKKLNSLLNDRSRRPKPMTPSKENKEKGFGDSSVAATVWTVAHVLAAWVTACPDELLSRGGNIPATGPKHTCSRTSSPVTFPVPYPMVTRSPSVPWDTRDPSTLIATEDTE